METLPGIELNEGRECEDRCSVCTLPVYPQDAAPKPLMPTPRNLKNELWGLGSRDARFRVSGARV